MPHDEPQRYQQCFEASATYSPSERASAVIAYASGALQPESGDPQDESSSCESSLDPSLGPSHTKHMPRSPGADQGAANTSTLAAESESSAAEGQVPDKRSATIDLDAHSHSSRVQPGLEQGDYESRIGALSSVMPHLRKVRMPARVHNRAEFSIFDYTSETLVAKESYAFDALAALQAEKKFRGLVVEDIPVHVRLRLVLVEDLSNIMISLLGNVLNINPEVFEAHLMNSGWSNGKYGDPEATKWNTAGTNKDYASIRWYRPIHRNEEWIDQQLTLSRNYLFSQNGIYILNDESRKSAVNIMRRKWNPRPWASVDSYEGHSAGWEERLTMWSTYVDGCALGK